MASANTTRDLVPMTVLRNAQWPEGEEPAVERLAAAASEERREEEARKEEERELEDLRAARKRELQGAT